MTRVLVAEDDVDIRNLLTLALSLQHFDVVEAFDGKDAIEKARHHHPDILLLDIIMPLLNGFEVCEMIKNDDELKNTPIIFISAKIDQEEVQKSRSLGVETMIEKPFDFSFLVSRIQLLLDTSNKDGCA